ncbi:hypothetical protein F8A86_11690 [Betaproteobacteria bacterium SCN1]|nr:hypothetical protein F8A86_11690 [Betaproteobacteria bacterium SCN1]
MSQVELVTKRSALDGARLKGAEAARSGLPVQTCPYRDKRTDSGRLSWSRAFRNAWLEGHRKVSQLDLFGEMKTDCSANAATGRKVAQQEVAGVGSANAATGRKVAQQEVAE